MHTATKLSMCFFQVKNGESRIRPRILFVVLNGNMILFSLIIGGLELVVFKGLSNKPMSFNQLLVIVYSIL